MAFHETDRYLPEDIGGACFFCSSSQRRDGGTPERMFRADRGIDHEGNIVICEACTLELCDLAGCLSRAKSSALKTKNTELQKQNREVLDALAAATATVDALRYYDEAGMSG